MDREGRQIRQAIIDTSRALAAKGLDEGATAALAVRHVDGLLVTPAGIDREHLVPHDVVHMDWEGCFSADHRPNAHWRLMRDVLAARAEVDVVLAVSTPFATALACHGRGLPPFHYRVAAAGGADVRAAPYAGLGTPELSKAALGALEGRRACLLAHHGLVVVGASLDRTLNLAREVEALARMYLHALVLGEPPHLDAAEAASNAEKLRRVAAGFDPLG